MQDNTLHTGSNWTGQCPRTLREAGLSDDRLFPQLPCSSYEQPTVGQKVADVAALVGGIAVFCLALYGTAAIVGVA